MKSKLLKKRKNLFDKFSHQLNLLKDNGFLNIDLKYEKTYICPLCLEQFQENDLVSSNSTNFLTEEDAPPEKLGGNRIALTCKNCNSKAGHDIDVHLINRLKYIDNTHFHEGNTQPVNIKFGNNVINSEITPDGNGNFKVVHKKKNNNPPLLKEFISNISNKPEEIILDFELKKIKNDSIPTNLAILKTNYIITFSKFGYIFLLDSYYDSIREQIKMEQEYEGQISLVDQFTEDKIGTYYVNNKNAKSILNVYSLKTDYSTKVIGSIFPLPNKSFLDIHKNLGLHGNKISEGQIAITLDTKNYDPNADLFSNIEEIKKIVKWVRE